MALSELARIELLSKVFSPQGASHPEVLVGIGDDAAVLAPSSQPLVWTVDAAVEGSHFRREWLSFEDIGFRSTMAAASDLAAMAAEPLGVLSSLVLPDDVDDAALAALARGQQQAAAALGTAILGGNLARGRELSITTTVLGRAPQPLTRTGARPGDALWLLGPVGLAAAGLRLLSESRPLTSEAARTCVTAWRRPRARIAEALALRAVATAAIDVSDGLARDVGHIARACGLRAVIDMAALEATSPAAAWTRTLAEAAAQLALQPRDLALFGGEDYAVAFAAPPGAHFEAASRIGEFEPADPAHSGVFARHADGTREPLRAGGFDHFSPKNEGD